MHADEPSMFLEPRPAEVAPELVADAVTDDGADRCDRDGLGQVQHPDGAQDAGENDDGLARHEEAEKGRGLERGGEEQQQVAPVPDPPEDREEIVDQDATRRPERSSNSSCSRSERFAMRAMVPQYRQWMNAGS